MLALGFCAQAGLAHAQFTDDLGFSAPSSVVQGSGARALGMGGAFLARADDATAVSWNPAGLSYLARPELCVVGVHKGFAQSTTDRHSETLYAEDFQGTSPDFLSAAWPIRLEVLNGGDPRPLPGGFAPAGTPERPCCRYHCRVKSSGVTAPKEHRQFLATGDSR